MVGQVDPWSCYWEWVWQDLGFTSFCPPAVPLNHLFGVCAGCVFCCGTCVFSVMCACVSLSCACVCLSCVRACSSDAYMHRPTKWGFVQFAPPSDTPPEVCGNIEFPGRHVALQIHLAQRAFFQKHNAFTENATELVASCAAPDCATKVARTHVLSLP